MSTTLQFQHLESVNPQGTNDIAIIGRCMDGKSVCAIVHNVKPHITVRNELNMKAKDFEVEINECIRKYIVSKSVLRENDDLERQSISNFHKKCTKFVEIVTVEETMAQNIMDYREEGPISFFKCTVKSKRYLYDLKKVLSNTSVPMVLKQVDENKKVLKNTTVSAYLKSSVTTQFEQMQCGVRGHKFTLFNDQVDFMLQYFIDNNMYSCGWFEVFGNLVDTKISSCDIEINVATINQQKNMNMLAPWKIFSYDIESLPRPRGTTGKFDFPDSSKDPVVTIGGVLEVQDKLLQFVWILRPSMKDACTETLPPVDGEDDYKSEITTVFDFHNESEMLKHFFRWCVNADIDLIQGHNCNRFDNTYMIGRYKALFGSDPIWSRLLAEPSTIKVSSFSSNQKGTSKIFKLHLPGRCVFDSYDIMKDQHNEASYKLDNLAEKYLGTKKIDMDYDLIYPKYHDAKGRVDLAVYCVKDAWLVYKLLSKLCKLTVISQMSTVCGISMKDVLGRGQGIRCISLMLRYAKDRNPVLMLPRVEIKRKTQRKRQFSKKNGALVMDDVEVEIEQSFKGAVVVDPSSGFYTDAVSCLDFASLYPSIMQAMNMSYETLVYKQKVNKYGWKQDEDIRTIPDYDYIEGKLVTKINPHNPSFIMKNKRKGLLPEILDELLAARKMVKKQMKQCDPESTMYKVFNGKQLSYKVCCNSVYGFTGATVGFLPCRDIAQSVTKYGRGLTLKTKSLIENHPKWGRNGAGCHCIYGDTDSVFVHVPRTLVDGKNDDELMENAHKFGEVMADYVTKVFISPIFLEYEKSFSSFLLIKKKRYAGYKYEPGLKPKLYIKGLESVRRDYAPLLVKIQKQVLHALIIQKDTEEACRIIKQTVYDLKMNKVPLDLLIMSKKLSRPVHEYKSKAPHVQLTKRLMKQTPEMAPVSGDRVPFIIYSGTGGSSDRAATPEEVRNGKFIVDRNYYLKNQLEKPLMRLMQCVLNDPQHLFTCRSLFKEGPTAGNMFSAWKTEEKRDIKRKIPQKKEEKSKKMKTMSITSFFKKK